jgi:SAM-dependent methyltransferase
MFVKAFRQHLSEAVVPGTRALYEARAVPAFKREHGHVPNSYDEVRTALFGDPYYKMWSALQRSSQEAIWDSVIDTLEHDHDARIAAFQELASDNPAGGSLTLNPDVKVPRYISAADIHLMPGGYHEESLKDDVAQGALYDRGLYLYIGGNMGPDNDGLGHLLAAKVKSLRPDWAPKRILDVGCGAGHQTLPWKQAFPDAEVHGLDIAAPMLRYGHARAESLGIEAHFHQADLENTDFPDGHFDLIVSCLFMHETSNKALPKCLAECKRLLSAGGLMAHMDVPQREGMEMFQSVVMEWEEWNNNENFARLFKNLDLVDLGEKAGFETIECQRLPMQTGGQTKAYDAGAAIEWTLLTGEV